MKAVSLKSDSDVSPPSFLYTPPLDPLRILFFDDEFIVIDKPAGLLTVPGKHEDHRDCLETRVKIDHPNARIVHRLDMDTSGVIIMAQNAKAHRHLGLQFERRHVAKTYSALVWGNVAENEGIVDLPLRCDWPNRPKQMVDFEKGRSATTTWRVIEHSDNTTRLALYPKTGRSHQLRVHMLELGHPILGDRFYAPKGALEASERLLLHAERLEFYHPANGKRIAVESPCPF